MTRPVSSRSGEKVVSQARSSRARPSRFGRHSMPNRWLSHPCSARAGLRFREIFRPSRSGRVASGCQSPPMRQIILANQPSLPRPVRRQLARGGDRGDDRRGGRALGARTPWRRTPGSSCSGRTIGSIASSQERNRPARFVVGRRSLLASRGGAILRLGSNVACLGMAIFSIRLVVLAPRQLPDQVALSPGNMITFARRQDGQRRRLTRSTTTSI